SFEKTANCMVGQSQGTQRGECLTGLYERRAGARDDRNTLLTHEWELLRIEVIGTALSTQLGALRVQDGRISGRAGHSSKTFLSFRCLRPEFPNIPWTV